MARAVLLQVEAGAGEIAQSNVIHSAAGDPELVLARQGAASGVVQVGGEYVPRMLRITGNLSRARHPPELPRMAGLPRPQRRLNQREQFSTSL